MNHQTPKAKNKPGRSMLPLVIALITGAGIALLGAWIMRPNMAFVRTSEVFAEFSLSKELHRKLEASQRGRAFVLDSLSAQVEVLGKRWQALQGSPKVQLVMDTLRALSEVYEAKKSRFEEESALQARQYDEQIWAQLNPYIQEYVQEHRITYLFGADGSGVLMGADKSEDITEEVIAFVNNRYQGIE